MRRREEVIMLVLFVFGSSAAPVAGTIDEGLELGGSARTARPGTVNFARATVRSSDSVPQQA